MKQTITRAYKEVWLPSPAWFKVWAKAVLTYDAALVCYVVISRFAK